MRSLSTSIATRMRILHIRSIAVLSYSPRSVQIPDLNSCRIQEAAKHSKREVCYNQKHMPTSAFTALTYLFICLASACKGR
eukprot:scaffold13630_cov96-Skeletonema_dohrnii-CCMP3373.AAC.3